MWVQVGTCLRGLWEVTTPSGMHFSVGGQGGGWRNPLLMGFLKFSQSRSTTSPTYLS